MAGTDGDGLADLPPSAKLVYKVLEYDGPLTQKQIVEESMLSARTVRYALERLEDADEVDEDIYFADARQSLYRLTVEEEAAADGGVSEAGETGLAQSSEACEDADACCVE